jgi:hypothetical protein
LGKILFLPIGNIFTFRYQVSHIGDVKISLNKACLKSTWLSETSFAGNHGFYAMDEACFAIFPPLAAIGELSPDFLLQRRA